MGSMIGDSDARPLHKVAITTFRMSQYPITVREFGRFVADTGYQTISETVDGSYVWDGDHWEKNVEAFWRKPLFVQSPQHPVTCITWYDAVVFCNWLSIQSGLSPCYLIDPNRADSNNHYPENDPRWTIECDFAADGFRLPTEAEWEFAARGGMHSQGFRYAGSNDARDVAWFIGADRTGKSPIDRREDYGRLLNTGTTMAVGTKKPNEIGLYDMSGNVREWCWDWYDENFYHYAPSVDPQGPFAGAFRVNRGGSWQTNNLVDLESTHRNYGGTSSVFTHFGFRVVTRC